MPWTGEALPSTPVSRSPAQGPAQLYPEVTASLDALYRRQPCSRVRQNRGLGRGSRKEVGATSEATPGGGQQGFSTTSPAGGGGARMAPAWNRCPAHERAAGEARNENAR